MRILIVTASPLETEGYSFGYRTPLESVDHIISGVGKLNAYIAVRKALRSTYYDVIVNAGTCGSTKHPVSTVLLPKRAYHADLMEVGVAECLDASVGNEQCAIATADRFYSNPNPIEDDFACHDMEAFAVLKACEGIGEIETHFIKVVSDNCNGDIHDWEAELPGLRLSIADAIQVAVQNYIPEYKYEKVSPTE